MTRRAAAAIAKPVVEEPQQEGGGRPPAAKKHARVRFEESSPNTSDFYAPDSTNDEDQLEPEEATMYSLRGARPIGKAVSNSDGSWSMSPAGSPPPSTPDTPAEKRGKAEAPAETSDAPAKKRGTAEAPAETSGKRRKVEKEKVPVESSGKRRKADTPTASSSTNTVAPAAVPPSAVPPAALAVPLSLDPAVASLLAALSKIKLDTLAALSGVLGAAAPPPQPPQ
jgi:hypothetical protein